MPLTKPVYNKPKEFADQNIWGAKLNTVIDQIDGFQQSVVTETQSLTQEIARLDNEKIGMDQVDTIIGTKVDNYVESNVKPNLDSYIESQKTNNIKPYIDSLKSEAKAELDNFNEEQKKELDEHEKLKEGEITALTEQKKTEITTLSDEEKVKLISQGTIEKNAIIEQGTKTKAEVVSVGDEEKVKLTTHSETLKVEITTHANQEESKAILAIQDKSTTEQATIREKGQEELDKLITTGVDNLVQKTTQIIAGAGLIGGGDLSANRTVSIASSTDGIVVNEDNIELSLVDNFTNVSSTKAPSSTLLKSVNDRIDALQGGGDISQLKQFDDFARIHHSGILSQNERVINVGKVLYNPSLYLDGTRIESELFTISSDKKTITLNAPMASYSLRWVIEDNFASYIKFSAPTMSAIVSSADIKSLIELENVISILGKDTENDGGHHLVICEAQAKVNAVDIGDGRFLNEIPYTNIKSIIEGLSTTKSSLTRMSSIIIDVDYLKSVESGTHTLENVEIEGLSTGNYVLIVHEDMNKGMSKHFTLLKTGNMERYHGCLNAEVFSGWSKVWADDGCETVKDTNGYCKLPNGVIMQWGHGDDTLDIMLPVAFTKDYSFTFTPYSGSAKISSKDNFSVHLEKLEDENLVISWIALGY